MSDEEYTELYRAKNKAYEAYLQQVKQCRCKFVTCDDCVNTRKTWVNALKDVYLCKN